MGAKGDYQKREAVRRAWLGVLCGLWLGLLPLHAQEVGSMVPAGTRVRVQFTVPVGSAISRPGDGVEVRLLKPVEIAGRVALPAGAILSGRVLAARAGHKKTRTFPMLRLGFDRLTLPDGRAVPVAASLADLGTSVEIDAEGAATRHPVTKGEDIAVAGTSGAAGAGIGGIAGGGKGAAVGAGVGAAVGVLADLAAHSMQWEDIVLKKGRKGWLRLDSDLEIPARESPPPSKAEDLQQE